MIQPVMITCPGREEKLSETLASLCASDWPVTECAVIVRLDDSQAERRQERQEQNARAALRLGYDSGAPYVMFLEDDLEFNRHIWHNLTRWDPLHRGVLDMGSLYNPNIHMIETDDVENWTIADPGSVYGSQAYVLSRRAVDYVTQRWAEVLAMQDIKISRLVAQMGSPIYYHYPSLVQHTGTVSAWGTNYFHTARDFKADWRSS